MSKFKSHKTVEEIARKHRLDISFIQKQLEMGEPIEHEHTKDHTLARDIALQHLDEIPDYYTRLKKMEADAKKHHKKFKDIKEEDEFDMDVPMHSVHIEKEKRYCPRCKKVELRSECKHGAICWDLFSLPEKLKEETKSGDSSLRDWFKKSSGKDPKTGKKVSGWVQLGGPFAGAPCARQPGQKSTPKCGSSKMAANLSDEEEQKAFERKNRNDPNQPEKKNSSKPTYVRTEEIKLDEMKEKKGKRDACYKKVKARYDVWPSAYGSGALVKCRKVGAANWGTKSEETMHEEERYCPLCDKRETRSECSYGGKAWDKVSVKDHEYSMARSELSTISDALKKLQQTVGKGEGNLEAWVQSKITKAADYLDTAADYVASGEMNESNSKEVSFTVSKSNPDSKVKNRVAKRTEKMSDEQLKTIPNIEKVKPQVRLPHFAFKEETSIADKILEDLLNEKCWPGYKRKKGTTQFSKGSCVKSENVTIEDAEGNTFAEVIDLIQPEPIKGFKSQIKEAKRLQAQTGNVILVTLNWRGKYYSLRMFFPQIKLPSRQEIALELNKVYPGCKVVQHSVSDFTPGEPLIQPGFQGGSPAKLGPNKNYVKPMGEEVELDEDWQSVNRKDKTDGLSQKAVNAYRRENPGSKLQTAVTEKNPKGKRKKRRSSFCRRMKGMRAKLTSAKTARDPKSKINKALRRWRCR